MTIGFIGGGRMGESLLAAFLKSGLLGPSDLAACDVSAERRSHLRKRYHVTVTADPAAVVTSCGILFLAVKPQDLDKVLTSMVPVLTKRHLLVSIAAGKTVADLERIAPAPRVVRVMPNLPVMVGEGMSAFCRGSRATAADGRTVSRLLAAAGRVTELDETLFDAVTALSGSGPAFFAYVMDALAAAAVAEGLPAKTARELACQTMLGTARYLSASGMAAADFIQAVASPKGTTAAGLAVLERSAVRSVLGRTLAAAARRSRQLSAG